MGFTFKILKILACRTLDFNSTSMLIEYSERRLFLDLAEGTDLSELKVVVVTE